MRMLFRLLCTIALLTGGTAHACPWCQRFGVKETVSAGEADPGGNYFGKVPPPERTRHYCIAAEPTQWTWAPLGVNTSKPLPLPPDLIARPTAQKVRYVQYTDATFTHRVLDTPRLGITGPILRGVVGDYLAVTFLNRAGQPLSMHPHGVRYDKDSEGAYMKPDPGKGSAVGPGATFTYVWHMDAMSGPQPGEPSSKCWLYHSHCTGDEEINLGLAGFIIVTDPARARPDGTPNDVDREMATLFMNYDETPEDEALDADLIEPRPPPRTELQTLELRTIGLRPSVNGMLYGNLPGLDMRVGERVRWYLGALGEDDGMHTPHWHGARVRTDTGRIADVLSVLPGETRIADQFAENPGTWTLHCHISDHMMGGMFANFTVHPAEEPAPPEPFLGRDTALETMRWTQAEVSLDFASQAAAPASVKLRGEVAIYQGFMARNNPPTIRVGGRTATLRFTQPSTASAEGIRWQVFGANEDGVLLAESMEFELSLEGDAWRETLASTGLRADAPATVDVPVEVVIGDITHRSSLALGIEHRDGKVHARLK
jgi:FtsP/CotA-like multicopper oxidase with cupredoxin domain